MWASLAYLSPQYAILNAAHLGTSNFIRFFALSVSYTHLEIFPDYTPKEREFYIAKAKGAVCIMQIGDTMENGEPHDGRAPDYDDWSLNADIVVYYPDVYKRQYLF